MHLAKGKRSTTMLECKILYRCSACASTWFSYLRINCKKQRKEILKCIIMFLEINHIKWRQRGDEIEQKMKINAKLLREFCKQILFLGVNTDFC